MPNSTFIGNFTYHSGFKLSSYMLDTYRQDPFFISEWRLDDISSGSGLDSQHLNHLIASGSPTQIVGNRLSSGVQFDGTDDCFYTAWWNASGLQSFIPNIAVNPPAIHYQIGFAAHLKVTDFSQERVIFSKWNETGNDKTFMLGINTSGGLFVQAKRNSSSTIEVFNTGTSGIIPSGQYFNFAFGMSHRGGSQESFWYAYINDTVVTQTVIADLEDDGASGLFVIGAANVGNSPSGFFKGNMEDIWFFNGKGLSIEEWNAYQSGVRPNSIRPSLNVFNPHIKDLWQLNIIETGTFGHIQNGKFVRDRIGNQHLFASGSVSGNLIVMPGAANGSKGSGIGFPGDINARFSRHIGSTLENYIWPKCGFTYSFWLRPNVASTIDRQLMGSRQGAASRIQPLTIVLNNMLPEIQLNFDKSNGTSETSPSSISSGVWSHIAIVGDFTRGRIEFYTSGLLTSEEKLDESGLWLQQPELGNVNSYFSIGATDEDTTSAYSGIMDEIVFFRYPLMSGEVFTLYNAQSGFILDSIGTSGQIGGFISGVNALNTSGSIGGYIIAGINNSGMIGGYISGVPFYQSGMLGGYIMGPYAQSGQLGGYIVGYLPSENTIGGYIRGKGEVSGLIGGYLVGVEPVDQDANFIAFFNIIGRDKKEFDAQLQIYKSLSNQFDAKITLYIDEKKPLVGMITPLVSQSGNTVPVTYHFEASGAGQQGKNIYNTFWFFTDDVSTSGSTITSSGTYYTEHTFTQSGLFNVIFVVVDEHGLVNSCRTIINTASGTTLPTITLSATPDSGSAPLSVAFSGTINSAPNSILDKFIYFGDGTRSASTNSIYKMYPVIGCYLPVFRVRDSQGLIATDSLVLGVNN